MSVIWHNSVEPYCISHICIPHLGHPPISISYVVVSCTYFNLFTRLYLPEKSPYLFYLGDYYYQAGGTHLVFSVCGMHEWFSSKLFHLQSTSLKIKKQNNIHIIKEITNLHNYRKLSSIAPLIPCFWYFVQNRSMCFLKLVSISWSKIPNI